MYFSRFTQCIVIFVASLALSCAYGKDSNAKKQKTPDITLEFLESKPSGIARDFYIWRYLSDENTKLQDAIKAYELVSRKDPKLNTLMSKKGKPDELPANFYCRSLDINALLQKDLACLKQGLRLSQVPNLPPKTLQALKEAIKSDANLTLKVEILSSKQILTQMLNADAKTFAEIFNILGAQQKERIINQTIKPASIKKLGDQNAREFNRILQKILFEDSLSKFKKSLLGAKITGADSYTSFLLGLYELQNGNKEAAIKYFKLSESKSKDSLFVNRARFWQYYCGGDEEVLKALSQSKNPDLYTLYAIQKLEVAPSYTIVSGFENLSSTKKPAFDITDPFEWQILRDNLTLVKDSKALMKLAENFAFSESEAHFAYVHNRASNFANSYFITPFSDKLEWKSTHQKAITYAVAKQESVFLPALVSTSYALGMMQIMPFNVEPFARSLGIKDITLEDMFNPLIALEFGRFYLGDLEREFKNPLFIAYAYNGGPGFLRRTLAKKTLFKKNRAYEPWLSLELLPIEETRYYGIKVLANYIVYQELFGNKVSVEEILKATLVN